MTTTTPIADATPAHELPLGRWLALTLGLLALLILASAAIAWRMDVFGIFRDPHGRQLITSEHERRAKYLLNRAYVPDNFDALIIGASSSVNWHPQDLTGYRFYNESLEGGDASEQRKIVEQALPKGHFKLALIVLYPRTTALHNLQDGFDQVSPFEALGSISTYGVEYDELVNKLTHRPSIFFPDGSHSFAPHAPPAFTGPEYSPLDPTQDPIAVADYRALVEELQAKGVRIVYVASPLFQRYLAENQAVITNYLAGVKTTLPPGPIIDFNAPEYLQFRSTPTNFIDSVHLSAQGSDTLSPILNTRLHQILNAQ